MNAATTTAVTDPERQFVGCLLSLPHDPARAVLHGMRADDLADPAAAHALQLVIEVVASGTDPHPTVLYAHATTTGHAPGEHRRHRLARWLADTYRDAPPPALAGHLKATVLETAWRRAITTHATRLLHAVDTSPTDVLAELVDDREPVDQLWTRYQHTLARPTTLEVAA